MPFDPICYDLAKHFLEDALLDTAENINRVAQTIQDTVEDEIRALELARDEEKINANSGVCGGEL